MEASLAARLTGPLGAWRARAERLQLEGSAGELRAADARCHWRHSSGHPAHIEPKKSTARRWQMHSCNLFGRLDVSTFGRLDLSLAINSCCVNWPAFFHLPARQNSARFVIWARFQAQTRTRKRPQLSSTTRNYRVASANKWPR